MRHFKSKVGSVIWWAMEFIALGGAILAITSLVVTISTGLVHVGLAPKTGNAAVDGDPLVLTFHLLIFTMGGIVFALASGPLVRRSSAAMLSLFELLIRWLRAR